MRKAIASLLALAVFAAPAQARMGGAGAPPVLVSPSATTVYLAWTEGAAAVGGAACGPTQGSYTQAAADNAAQTSSTSHASIVTGLVPGSTVWCQTTANTTNTFRVTTLPAPPSTPVTSVTIDTIHVVQPVPNQIQGDTFYNCISNDNTTYVNADDNHNFGNSSSSGSNMLFGKFISESPLTGANINTMPGFGTMTQLLSDNAAAKEGGLFCLNGNIYMTYGREAWITRTGFPTLFTFTGGAVIKSTDHGVTWANHQSPNSPTTAGAVPTPVGTATMFQSMTDMAAATFVMYGADDGTLGYRVDNADAYVYFVTGNATYNNGNALYMARVPRAKLPALNGADYTYFTGGDGALDANWSATQSAAAALSFSPTPAAGTLSGSTTIQYIPSVGRYLLFDWWDNGISAGSTQWLVYESQHPWGPWALVNTTDWIGNGAFYNPAVLMRSALAAAPNDASHPLTLLFSGDYTTCCGVGGYYHLWTTTAVVNTH